MDLLLSQSPLLLLASLLAIDEDHEGLGSPLLLLASLLAINEDHEGLGSPLLFSLLAIDGDNEGLGSPRLFLLGCYRFGIMKVNQKICYLFRPCLSCVCVFCSRT